MKCKYDNTITCDFRKRSEVRRNCRSFGCVPYLKKEVSELKLRLRQRNKRIKKLKDELNCRTRMTFKF